MFSRCPHVHLLRKPRQPSALSPSRSPALCLTARRTCISGVNSPYFQIENAPWSTTAEFRDTARGEPFPVFRCLDFDGNLLDPNFSLPMSESELLGMYATMHTVMAFDATFYRLARAGYLSFYMQNNGEEALQVGSAAAWRGEDVLFFQYRELGAFLQRGYDLQQCADVCFSNEADLAKGRQMPVHYGDRALNCVTISSTLATQMPQAAGAAYALKRGAMLRRHICHTCRFSIFPHF